MELKRAAVRVMLIGMAICLAGTALGQTTASRVRVERLLDSPIIEPGLHPSIGENIQGPSLIKVPDWIEDPLGTYYLYFADHKGTYIRLAYADDLLGPWHIRAPGSLQIAGSHFLTEPPALTPEEDDQLRAARVDRVARGVKLPHDVVTDWTTPHIASPDVHVDEEQRRVLIYFPRSGRRWSVGVACRDLARRVAL